MDLSISVVVVVMHPVEVGGALVVAQREVAAPGAPGQAVHLCSTCCQGRILGKIDVMSRK